MSTFLHFTMITPRNIFKIKQCFNLDNFSLVLFFLSWGKDSIISKQQKTKQKKQPNKQQQQIKLNWAWWYTPLTPATGEAQARGLQAQGKPGTQAESKKAWWHYILVQQVNRAILCTQFSKVSTLKCMKGHCWQSEALVHFFPGHLEH